MTDKTEPTIPQAIPVQPPAPIPLAPQTSPAPRRKVWPWVVGVVVLLVLIGGCVGAVWILDNSVNSITEELLGEDGMAGLIGPTESVAWSGNGRYGVVQYLREYTYPSVAVWDSTTGETQTLDGYRVLFVESAAPVVWLEPVTDEEAEMGASVDTLGDALDHKPKRLVAWHLDDGSKPTDNVPSKWHAWPGPADSIAYLEINPLKGAGPSALLFNNKESHGEGVKAKMPETVITFVPIGWSASGRYFAIEDLIDESIYQEDDVSAGLSRRLVVFDVTTGEVVTSPLITSQDIAAPVAAWDGASDILFWPELVESPNGETVSVRFKSIEATGAVARDAFDANGWERPGDFSSVYQVNLLGWDPTGPIYSVEGRLWQIGADGFTDLGMSESYGPGAWYPGSGLLGVEYGYNDGPVSQEWIELVRSDIHGGNRETVWTSPKTDVEDPGF
ncbi:MAG: hypothetical protein CVT59_01685 [Actinobacteria bacterium HGW-Actinobacteria-1]|nr:MAG: hypothetical protein CVT59_01685 [Actinobacteria bacterium HGW-Actinobacteria-1]